MNNPLVRLWRKFFLLLPRDFCTGDSNLLENGQDNDPLEVGKQP